METALESRSAPPSDTQLRSVLGRFCTGVTIVTACDVGEPVGFTCQSFSSLSLEPPYICLCVGKTSSTWPRIRDAGRLCINILAADQEGLCRSFARSGADKFAGVRWSESPNGSPLLDGVVAWIDCCLEREVDAGDHVIAIARVTDLGVHSDVSPLLFYRSTFGRMDVG